MVNAFKMRMVLSILLCTAAAILAVGSVSILTANHIIGDAAETTLGLRCELTATKLNHTISSMERSVEILKNQSVAGLQDLDQFQHSDAYVDNYTERMTGIMRVMAENTPGCMAVYIRYNPEIARATSGAFLVRNPKNGFFMMETPTDLSQFDPSDDEHVGWFYIPVREHRPVWLLPYENKNIDVYMVSYVIPIYINGINVGIVGMDIDYRYIQQMIRNISVYSSGYAFLTYEDKIMEHKDYPVYTSLYDVFGLHFDFDNMLQSKGAFEGEYTYLGVGKRFASTRLENGMKLFICAPATEIYTESRQLTLIIVCIAVISFLLIVLISKYVIEHVMRVANIDELTGISNRRYFLDIFQTQKLAYEDDYALFLLDIDHFKTINDTYGHNNGDIALKDLTMLLRNTLGSDVLLARWGGDEFIGVVKSSTAEERLNSLLERVRQAKDRPYGSMTISVGIQRFRRGMSFTELTRGADEALYQSKAQGRDRVTIH